MDTMTAEQAREMARDFLSLSNEVLDYHIRNSAGMSPEQHSDLTNLEISLRDTSRQFSGLAGTLSLADLQPTLDSIKGATGKMREAIREIKDVAKAIQMVGKIVGLGGALLSRDPRAIGGALKDLLPSSVVGTGE